MESSIYFVRYVFTGTQVLTVNKYFMATSSVVEIFEKSFGIAIHLSDIYCKLDVETEMIIRDVFVFVLLSFWLRV